MKLDYSVIMTVLCSSIKCYKILDLKCKNCVLKLTNRHLVNEKKFDSGIKEFDTIIIKKGV